MKKLALGWRGPTGRRGFTLPEAVAASVIVAVMFIAALNTLAASRATQLRAADRMTGRHLAMDLMSEIMSRAYEEPTDVPVFGPEGIEAVEGRPAYDDVDDYHGYIDDPPTGLDGSPLQGFSGWRRTVVVQWANPADLEPSPTPNTGLKRIEVVVERRTVPVATLVAFRSIGSLTAIPLATSNP
jgi:prepilin-type N-terminal cleavage/methylation domain-containing protein